MKQKRKRQKKLRKSFGAFAIVAAFLIAIVIRAAHGTKEGNMTPIPAQEDAAVPDGKEIEADNIALIPTQEDTIAPDGEETEENSITPIPTQEDAATPDSSDAEEDNIFALPDTLSEEDDLITADDVENADSVGTATYLAGAAPYLAGAAAYLYYEYDSYAVIVKYFGSDASVVIPSEIKGKPVTEIGKEAFFDCVGLKSVAIPDSVTKIGLLAFSCCTDLTSITIPDSITQIDPFAFLCCTNLKNVAISDNVTQIGYFTFGYCTNLEKIAIPDKVTYIFSYAFADCENMTGVTLSGQTDFASDAFEGCRNLAVYQVEDSGFDAKGGLPSVGGWTMLSLRKIALKQRIETLEYYQSELEQLPPLKEREGRERLEEQLEIVKEKMRSILSPLRAETESTSQADSQEGIRQPIGVEMQAETESTSQADSQDIPNGAIKLE